MRYGFVHVPKTGGNSILKVIEGGGPIYPLGHNRAIDLNHWPLIAITRNPYDRIVSAYFYLLKGGMGNSIDLESQRILSSYPGFKEFALDLPNLSEHIIHLRPMSYWLCKDYSIVVDKIFKIEDIEKIDKFLLDLGYTKKMSDFKDNPSTHDNYTKYMDPQIVEVINKVYDLDFELFNYEKL